MKNDLRNKRIAILATDGYEHSELNEPKKALEEAGATVQVIALKAGEIKGWKDGDWHGTTPVDAVVGDVNEADFDALVLPGGVINPDKLRQDPKAVAFVKAFMDAHKPVGAICHGPWTLVEADAVHDRRVTSYPSLRTDLLNAGAEWVDEEVVVDNGLITSRTPKDLPAFNKKLVEEVKEGVHA